MTPIPRKPPKTDLASLRRYLKIAAEFVAVEPGVLPIYERIEREIAEREAGATTSLDRALRLAQQQA